MNQTKFAPNYTASQLQKGSEKRILKMKKNGYDKANLILFFGSTGDDGGAHLTAFINKLF